MRIPGDTVTKLNAKFNPIFTEIITKVANQKAAKLPKRFSFFFFLSSSDRLAQYCVNLSRWFTHEKQHFILSSARPHRFFTTSKSHKVLVATHLKTMASNLGHHFLYLYYACALKDHLATIRNCYSRIRNEVNLPCTWAWDRRSRVCIVLSIVPGTWKD